MKGRDMFKIWVICVLFGVLRVMGGMVLKVENDYFCGTDDNYTHGMELGWYIDEGDLDTDRLRLGYGISQLIYTPRFIRDSYHQLYDRPWCGILTIYRETWEKRGKEVVRNRIEAGVLGPAARAGQTQEWFHDLIGAAQPMGWENQLPNEPVLNFYHERRYPLWQQDLFKDFKIGMEGIYGGTLGTTFINVNSGMGFKCGYNIPPYSLPSGIDPKRRHSRFFTYMMGELKGIMVMHNATIGDSFFRSRNQSDINLESVVGEYRYGLVIGYGDYSLALILCRRSAEFKEQMDGGMDWGLIMYEFVRNF